MVSSGLRESREYRFTVQDLGFGLLGGAAMLRTFYITYLESRSSPSPP